MWPTENDYIKAVTRVNPSPFSLLNTKKITVIKDENDQPVKRTGNNSVIFKVSVDEKFYALKCYTKEINNQVNYLSAVQKYIDDIHSSRLVPFELYESEIYVIKNENSFHGTYCVLLMPWIEGEQLFEYVKKCCEEKNSIELEKVFTKFQQLSVWLLQQPFVHGDLAAENIIHTTDGELLLVDYDNFLFNELRVTSGHSPWNQDYQHPKRNSNIINTAADDFSILVLAISLKALQFKPELFFTYNNESGLLFTANGLREGNQSAIYKELKNINDPYLQNLLHLLKISVNKQSIEVPLLSTCINDNDPLSYSRLLELQLEELKKELENSSSHIKILQTEVAKEVITKEKLLAENKRLKESITEKENSKKKKEALKKNLAMFTAGLTCIAALAGIFFYNSSISPANSLTADQSNQQVQSLPPAPVISPEKNTNSNTVNNNAATKPALSEPVATIKKESPLLTDKKTNVVSKNTTPAYNNAVEKTYASASVSFKHRKNKSGKSDADYNMFRSAGF